MKSTGFGYYLRDIRENAKITLRGLAQETKLDPAYLSRLERELNPAPRQEVVQRIAKALCDLQGLPIAECEKLKRDLLDSAGQLTDDADLIDDLKQRFAERLREKGTPESYIKDAVNKVSLEAMDRVLSGEESLEIASPGDFINDEIKESKSQGEDLSYRSIKKYAMHIYADEKKTTTVAYKIAINSLIKIGKEQGYLTYSEINDLLPEDLKTPEQVESIVTILEELDIVVAEEVPDADTDKLSEEDLIEFEEEQDAIEFDQDNSASDYIDSHSKMFTSYSFPSSSPSPRRRGRAVKKTKFRAGTRAFIEVDGDLTSHQEELLRSITNMVRSILKGK